MKVITFTTDFGTVDWFVGTMKGVILGIQPGTEIVDLTHEIPPGDIRAGAFALQASYRFFPKGTVHIAIVDPGVGSNRKGIVVQTSTYFFVAPDNGLLSWALRNEEVKSIRALENEGYFLHPISRTFHGRDIFSPVAAHLCRGERVQEFGPALENYARLPWPEPLPRKRGIDGQILYIDRFGNAITNIASRSLTDASGPTLAVLRGRRRLCGTASFYQAVPAGEAVAVFGSSGFLEIAVNGGRADKQLGLKIGDVITLRPQ
jgi:S-adenosyl-L-methionine hydrolase (adenosine-forming)